MRVKKLLGSSIVRAAKDHNCVICTNKIKKRDYYEKLVVVKDHKDVYPTKSVRSLKICRECSSLVNNKNKFMVNKGVYIRERFMDRHCIRNGKVKRIFNRDISG